MRWTVKQRNFVYHYLQSFNASEAARKAGYSEKTSGVIGHELLKKPEIQAEIKRLLSENAMSAEEVLSRLADHARGSLGDFLEIYPDGDGFFINLQKAKEAQKLGLIKKLEVTRKVDKEGNVESWAKVELHDPQSALVHLGKHHSLFTDKLLVENNELEPWERQAIDLIKSNGYTLEDVEDAFGTNIARQLFEKAGLNSQGVEQTIE